MSKSYRFIERKNSILFCPVGKEDFKKNVDLIALKKLVEENQKPSPMNSPVRARAYPDKLENMKRRRYSSIKKADSRMFLLDEEENMMTELNAQNKFRRGIRARQMSLITQQKGMGNQNQVRRISLIGGVRKPFNQRMSIQVRNINQIQKLEDDIQKREGAFRKRTKTLQLGKKDIDIQEAPNDSFMDKSKVSNFDNFSRDSPKLNLSPPVSPSKSPFRSNQPFQISPEYTDTQNKTDLELQMNDNLSLLGGMSMLSEDYDRRVDKLERLIETDKSLNKVKPCIICSEKIPDCVFEPCGHGGMCYSCCDSLLQHKDTCPFCRIVSILHPNIISKLKD